MVTGGFGSGRLLRALCAAVVVVVTGTTGALVGPTAVADPLPPGGASLLRLAPDPGSATSSLDVRLDARPWTTTRAGRTRTARLDTTSYSLLGLTWQRGDGGDGPVRVRVRTDGSWGAWRVVERLRDLPDASSGEGIEGLAATEPLWVGPSDGVQVEMGARRPVDLRLALIDPGVEPGDSSPEPSAAATPATPRTDVQRPRHHRSPEPHLLGRGKWGAKASWRNGGPRYNRSIKQVHLHHTATGNAYSRADVPRLIRGMYRYHTHNLGWSDLGYNFLVDRFGRAWVGRAGGAGRPVRGAHTLGFNETSVGIAMIGDFDRRKPTQKALTAVVRLAAWKLDRYHRVPVGWTHVWSHGSDNFAAGTRVALPVIDGHRDTNQTACPGGKLYARLDGIRRRAQIRVDRWS